MKIGLDLRGVVIDSVEVSRRALECETGLVISQMTFLGKQSVEAGIWCSYLNGPGGRALELDDWTKAMRFLHETSALVELSELMPGAAESIRSLVDANHEVGIVTSTKGLNDGNVWTLVQKHKLPVTFVHATQKRPKTQFYNACDAVIDDDPAHLYEVRAHIISILMQAPLRHQPDRLPMLPQRLPSHIRVAVGWPDVMKQVAMAA